MFYAAEFYIGGLNVRDDKRIITTEKDIKMKFLSTICVAAIASALFKILVPENKYSKQISLLTAGVFLLIAVTAFAGIEPQLDISEYEKESDSTINDFSSGVNEQLREEVCKKTEEKIRDLLAEKEIYPEQVHIIVNISGLYSIDITEIRIVLGENSDRETDARELLESELPQNIKITIT